MWELYQDTHYNKNVVISAAWLIPYDLMEKQKPWKPLDNQGIQKGIVAIFTGSTSNLWLPIHDQNLLVSYKNHLNKITLKTQSYQF